MKKQSQEIVIYKKDSVKASDSLLDNTFGS